MKARETIEKQIFSISEDDRKTITSVSEEIKMATETRVVNEELIQQVGKYNYNSRKPKR